MGEAVYVRTIAPAFLLSNTDLFQLYEQDDRVLLIQRLANEFDEISKPM